jgi:hypothetical protein
MFTDLVNKTDPKLSNHQKSEGGKKLEMLQPLIGQDGRGAGGRLGAPREKDRVCVFIQQIFQEFLPPWYLCQVSTGCWKCC